MNVRCTESEQLGKIKQIISQNSLFWILSEIEKSDDQSCFNAFVIKKYGVS